MADAVTWQKVEGALVALAGATIYATYGANYAWWIVLVVFLSPDLSFVAYGLGQRIGAITYNLLHLYGVGAALLAAGLAVSTPHIISLGALWLAHAGADRALGYGLKTGKGFHHTHLGPIGPMRRENRS